MLIKQNKKFFTYKSYERISPYLFVLPFFIVFILFYLFPMLSTFFLSMCKWSGIEQIKFVGFRNFIFVLTDEVFLNAFKNIVVILLTQTSAIIFVALVIAYILNSGMAGRGRDAYQAFYFLPYITPGIAVGMLFSFLFDWQIGIVNGVLIALKIIGEPINWTGTASLAKPLLLFVLTWKYFGYVMVLVLAGLKTIPNSINEAATVDGANNIQTFFRITLPMLKNILSFVVITSIIGTFQLFDEPVTLFSAGSGMDVSGGPGGAAATTMMYLYQNSFISMKLGVGAATAVILFFMVIFCSFIGLKISSGRQG